MRFPIDAGFVLLFAVVWPVYEALVGYPRFKRALAADLPGARPRMYARAIATQWLLAAIALVVWILPGRRAAALGLAAPSGTGFWIGAALVLLIAGFLHAQYRALAAKPAALGRVREQLTAALPMLPHTPGELRGFMALSVTAGVCEELLYRGFLMTWLAGFLGVAGAVIASSVAFGIAHGYLDRANALKAGLTGLAMAGLVVLSHSLWLPMAAHAFIDINSGSIVFLALQQPARERPRAA